LADVSFAIHRIKERRMSFHLQPEEGQGMLEYSLVLALVAIIIIVVLALLGPAIGNMFSNVVTQI
jgi:pilus assembly protein Flp/PilA